jgi:predicted HAD superfamily hydrolase
MLIRAEKAITKEQYERAQINNGYVTEADLQEIFSTSELCGWGVYSPIACKRYNTFTDETTYIVSYSTSTCCD